jgi:hypothetical protein
MDDVRGPKPANAHARIVATCDAVDEALISDSIR